MKTPDPGRLVPWLVSAALVCALFFNGLDLSWFAVSLLLLLLWFTLNGIGLYRTGLATGSRALPVMVMLFWLWLGLGIPFTPVRYLGAVNFWWLGALPLGYLAFLLTPDREKFWQRLLPLLLWIGIALSGYALYQYFWLQSPPNATFFTKNSLAAFLSLLLFPALAQVLVASRLRDRWLGALAVVLFAFLLGLIQSRGAWLGLAGGLVLLYGLGVGGTRHTRWLTGLALIVAGFVAAALVIPWVPEAGGGLLERVVSLRDTASA
ncbi:MAG TPA: hypothetical protein EYP40_05150, partial [Chromatiales bacterium]|nr:hypothetical protein [Chromatiales bacterium]